MRTKRKPAASFENRSQTYELAAVDALRVHPANPRRGKVEQIAQSIAVNGFYGAVVAQKSTGHILAGNHRFLAAKAQGASEVPVIWLDVDDKAARRILLVDNRTNDAAGYDDEALATLLEQARNDADLLGTGYTEADFDRLVKELGDEAIEKAGPELGALEYRIVVECDGEAHQAEVLSHFEGMGLRCKPMVS